MFISFRYHPAFRLFSVWLLFACLEEATWAWQTTQISRRQTKLHHHHPQSPPLPSSVGDDFNDSPCFTTNSRRSFLVETTIALATSTALSPSLPAHAAYIDPITSPPKITQKVYLDVEYSYNNERRRDRLMIGLFGDAMPRVVDNFAKLCETNAYEGTSFYRILSGYCMQGGAIGDPTGNSGRSYAATNGDTTMFLEPDNFNIQHTQRGLVSMVRSTREGGIDSRFLIQLTNDGGWANDRYAAFGQVIDDDKTSKVLLERLENLPVQPPKNNPKQPVTIVASGLLP
uniref:Peptidyl-prolyl cis-trans isomerase n=1 Tax=Amphora coffeiformis TaxID=265554 RepID=A0A7S3PD96_9STRA